MRNTLFTITLFAHYFQTQQQQFENAVVLRNSRHYNCANKMIANKVIFIFLSSSTSFPRPTDNSKILHDENTFNRKYLKN